MKDKLKNYNKYKRKIEIQKETFYFQKLLKKENEYER